MGMRGDNIMNPDRIYRQHRDDALADQVTATEYATFVAMPFEERFSYRSRDVFKEVICAAATLATNRREMAIPFACPKRADDRPGVAGVITEDIVVDILESHFFVADLTFANAGVLLEAGAALGLKSNDQIIFLLQGDPRDLHFDIRNNRVIRYDSGGAVEVIATALIAAARAFEGDRQRYVESVKRSLSPDAIQCLRWYAELRKKHPGEHVSLHRKSALQIIERSMPLDEVRMEPEEKERWILEMLLAFGHATRELIQRRLLWTDYKTKVPATDLNPDAEPGQLVDVHGMHATDLGWAVIEHMWPELRRV
jgi:hypothetical protein